MNNLETNKAIDLYTKSKFRVIELTLWFLVAILVIVPSLIRVNLYPYPFEAILESYYGFLIAALIGIFPILFRLVFSKYPFEYMRDARKSSHEIKIENSSDVKVLIQDNSENQEDKNDYLLYCIRESEKISERVYTRSGAYLFIGCIIAFLGVALFYSPLFPMTQSQGTWSDKLIDYLPRFGALFLIEFIAFFFLKQYRIMLEEFRYYEAIKRKRQDNYSLIYLINEHKTDTELQKTLIANFSTEYMTEKLGKEETTKVLETEKLVNSDLDIFSKFTELVKIVKNGK